MVLILRRDFLNGIAFFLLFFWKNTSYGQRRGTHLRVPFAEEMQPDSLICNLKFELAHHGFYMPSDLDNKKLQILDGNVDYLSLNKLTGIVRSKRRVDREALCDQINTCCQSRTDSDCKLTLQIAVMQQDATVMTAPEIIIIEFAIIDINDHAPKWLENLVNVDIPEHTTVGFRFKLATAFDPDAMPNATVRYELSGVNEHFTLEIERFIDKEQYKQDIFLKIIEDLDRETRSSYLGMLFAIDGGSPPLTGSVTLQITITDINDHSPKFQINNSFVVVTENSMLGKVIASVAATDLDPSDKHRLTYRLSSSVNPEVSRVFSIDSQSGDIVLMANLDYEKKHVYQIPVRVTDGKHVVETTFTVKVRNENDNAPRININPLLKEAESNVFEVFENSEPIQLVASVSVVDNDDPAKDEQVTCTIENNDFEIQPLSDETKNLFKILTRRSLDREVKSKYYFSIKCTDGGSPVQSASQPIQIKVKDENDSPPVFQRSLVTVRLNETPEGQSNFNQFVIRMMATDQDEGIHAQLIYSLDAESQNFFFINTTTGSIRAIRGFDREVISSLNLTIYAQDCGGIASSCVKKINTGTASLIVLIQDINDCSPVFDQHNADYEFSVRENSNKGHVVGRVHATDADVDGNNRRIRYAKLHHLQAQHFNLMSDGSIQVNTDLLDRETISNYTFNVIAEDDGLPFSLRSTALVTIKITDENDNAPQWVFPSRNNKRLNISIHETAGHHVAKLYAVDKDEGINGEVKYSLVGDNSDELFEVRSYGELLLKRSITKKDAQQMYKLKIKAYDSGVPMKNSEMVVDVYIVRQQFYTPTKVERQVESNLIIIITMIAVTLIISLLLIAAVVLLRNTSCAKLLGLSPFNASGRHVNDDYACVDPNVPPEMQHQQKFEYPPKYNTIVINEGTVLLEDATTNLNKTYGTQLDSRGACVAQDFFANFSSDLPVAIDSKKYQQNLSNNAGYTVPRFRCSSTEQLNHDLKAAAFQFTPDHCLTMGRHQLQRNGSDYESNEDLTDGKLIKENQVTRMISHVQDEKNMYHQLKKSDLHTNGTTGSLKFLPKVITASTATHNVDAQKQNFVLQPSKATVLRYISSKEGEESKSSSTSTLRHQFQQPSSFV